MGCHKFFEPKPFRKHIFFNAELQRDWEKNLKDKQLELKGNETKNKKDRIRKKE